MRDPCTLDSLRDVVSGCQRWLQTFLINDLQENRAISVRYRASAGIFTCIEDSDSSLHEMLVKQLIVAAKSLFATPRS